MHSIISRYVAVIPRRCYFIFLYTGIISGLLSFNGGGINIGIASAWLTVILG